MTTPLLIYIFLKGPNSIPPELHLKHCRKSTMSILYTKAFFFITFPTFFCTNSNYTIDLVGPPPTCFLVVPLEVNCYIHSQAIKGQIKPRHYFRWWWGGGVFSVIFQEVWNTVVNPIISPKEKRN